MPIRMAPACFNRATATESAAGMLSASATEPKVVRTPAVLMSSLTEKGTPWLNGKHTIFGEVTDDDSRKVVDTIAGTRTGAQDRPVEDVVIERVEIQR